MNITLVKPGTRIEVHPATDLWMMGARYGVIIEVINNGESARIDMDNYGPTYVGAADILHTI